MKRSQAQSNSTGAPTHAFAKTQKTFRTERGVEGGFYSLPALAKIMPNVARLPVSLRIVLESVLRNCDGKKVTTEHVERLANWKPNAERTDEIPFVVARVVLQDFTGVPLLADLAAMRNVAAAMGRNPKTIEPLVPVDLVVDHSVMIDHYGNKKALDLNMKLEFQRNRERYEFMKWGMQAFDTFGVVPPGFGIVHQVNLEYLARGVHRTPKGRPNAGVYYPDSLVGTDSHTTMINGIGVVGWGVGGIEAEAAMLGQPVYLLTPDVVGFELTGRLREGVTARPTSCSPSPRSCAGPRSSGSSSSSSAKAPPASRCPTAQPSPTWRPNTERRWASFRSTRRPSITSGAPAERRRRSKPSRPTSALRSCLACPSAGDIDYSAVVTLDLGSVAPSLAGPKRPQDRIELGHVKSRFTALFSQPPTDNGFNQPAAHLHLRHLARASEVIDASVATVPATAPGAARDVVEMVGNRPTLEAALSEAPAASPAVGDVSIGNGDVLIAAITSCTNTSNPSVLLAAGLLAKKAVEAGLKVQPHIKTSLAPGSRIVTEYLEKAGLLPYLEKLGFYLAGYGCTTCIGNAGDLRPEFNEAITRNDLICAAVLSGNRNFEARIHPNLKANFLASPPLVVAYAIAGTVLKDLMTEPLGKGKKGRDIYLGDVWPTSDEIQALMKYAMNGKGLPKELREGRLGSRQALGPGRRRDRSGLRLAHIDLHRQAARSSMASRCSRRRRRRASSARVRWRLFGDSITTDHISPAGSIKEASPAGAWLGEHHVLKADFNSYGSRRGHHDVMVRGTFANVRIKNLMIPASTDGSREEGGVTLHQPTGEKLFIYDAAMRYLAAGTPTVIFAGEEYGTGSSRDWAAKGTALLGIKAVVARSFERIHRSNLVGMGVLPLQFQGNDSWQSLGIQGTERFDIELADDLQPQQDATLVITSADGQKKRVPLTLRIDTPIEVDYYRHGGILPFVLRQLLAS